MSILIAMIGILGLMAIGAHVATSMGLVSALLVLSVDGVPMAVIAQTAFSSINSYPLMAVPMFILMGNIMMHGNIVTILVDLIGCLVRFVRGGLALTVMTSCVFFAAISGSSVASASAIGASTVRALQRDNYPGSFSAALVAVGGTLGIMIPPSLGFILIGTVVGIPVDKLFIAGIIPGLFEAVLLLATTYWICRKKGYGSNSATFDPKGFVRRLPHASGALAMPVLIMGSIYFGLFTPTEVSAVSAGFAIILCVLVYRTIQWKDVWNISKDSILQTSMIFAIVLGGCLIGFILARMGASNAVVKFMTDLDMKPWQFLLLSNVILLILGTFLEGVAMIILTAPLLFPMATQLGINPIHFAVIMVANVEIATLTPPIGLNIFVMSSISKVPVEEVNKGVKPFYATRLFSLLIISAFPSLSLMLL